MKKVIYFDSWTGGISNYLYIDKKLDKRYITTLLLHMESKIVPYYYKDIDTSWYKNKEEQIIEGILCRDISAYNKLTIADILAQEAPDLVIMLSLSHLQNRVATEACRRLGIKIIFMMHGVKPNKAGAEALAKEMAQNYRYMFLYKLSKIPKFLSLLREYHCASKNLIKTILLAKQLAVNPFKFIWYPQKHTSLSVNKALVYSHLDAQSFAEIYKIPMEDIIVVGNPKLDILIDGMSEQNCRQETSQILYLEQPLTDIKLLTIDEQRELLNYIDTIVRKNDLKLLIRLHPNSNRELFLERYPGNYQFTEDGESLLESFSKARIVIGHYSTALIEAIAYRIPTVSISWLNAAISLSPLGENDPGIVQDKHMFESKVDEFLKLGWTQDGTRQIFFPNGRRLATDVIADVIDGLINHN